MTTLQKSGSSVVHIRNGIGMAIGKSGIRIHEKIDLPDCIVSLPMLELALNRPGTATLTKSHLVISSESRTVKVPIVDEEPIPEPEKHGEQFKLSLSPLRRAFLCNPPTPARAPLEELSSDEKHCCGTDGRMMVIINSERIGSKFQIHRSALPLIEDDNVMASVGKNSVSLESGGVRIWVQNHAAPFDVANGCKTIFKQSAPAVLGKFKSAEVLDVLQQISNISESVRLMAGNGVLEFSTDAFSERINIEGSIAGEIRLNPKYLLPAIKAVASESVGFGFNENLSIRLQSEDANAIVCGMRL
jgi:hypothetical protein